MALGKQGERSSEFWIATTDLAKSEGHPFYKRLNEVLRGAEFDRYVEELCAPYYADGIGRPGIPPGVYFRMLLVGYFEGIGSQRGIAWRANDSLSVREFLGLSLTEQAPDHSSLTVIRKRLPFRVHEQVFEKVLSMAREAGLVKGKRVAVDSTMLEANAAMKGIVRKATGEDWKAYVKRLAKEAGIEDPTDEDLRKFDKKRKKKVSNEEWKSPTDTDSRIMKMKDGRTRLGYKAEHAVDLDTEVILSSAVQLGEQGDADSLLGRVIEAQVNMSRAGSDAAIRRVAADKGYHKTSELAECKRFGLRTYIPERKAKGRRRWKGKAPAFQAAVYGNRRRTLGVYGRGLQRLRSEKTERSFAHLYETGGGRRVWIRGVEEACKRNVIHAAAHNLGLIMRKRFGVGTPRVLQGAAALVYILVSVIRSIWRRVFSDSVRNRAFRSNPYNCRTALFLRKRSVSYA